MDHFFEDRNIKLSEDTELDGKIVKAGTKLTFVSRQGEFSGFKMRVPPPEFEALIFFSALESAAKTELLKKMIRVTKSQFDGLEEIDGSEANRSNFYSMCQNGMSSVAFSISAIESWANNAIAIHGLKNGKPTELRLSRPNKSDRIVLSDSIASDSSIPIRPKLFQLVPQVFSTVPLKEHSTLKKQLGEVVEERNIVMHMQNKLSISDQQVERVNYAVKLFRTNAFFAPETVLKYISYIYKNSNIEEAPWVSIAKKDLKIFKRHTK